jgi:hypothetical protein
MDLQEFAMNPSSYIVFGQRPEKPRNKLAPKRKKRTYLKSPYETPLYNDLEGKRKEFLDKAMRAATKGSAMQVAAGDGSKEADADPYEIFLSAESVKRIRRCWKILLRANPDLRYAYSSSLIISSSFDPSVRTIGDEEDSMKDELHPYRKSQEQDIKYELQSNRDASYVPNSEFRVDATAQSLASEGEEVSRPQIQDSELSHPDSQFAGSATDPSRLISMELTKGAKVWAPHEIKLQTTVHKRGGELYVITAAGTSGRMKAPTRKSRFERIKSDIDHMAQQENRLEMHLEEFSSQIRDSLEKMYASTAKSTRQSSLNKEDVSAIEERIMKLQRGAEQISEVKKNIYSHRHMLEYAYERYKKIMAGDGTEPESLKRLRRLKNNEIPEIDEQVAQRIEYESANKIQSMVRRKVADKVRKRLIERRDKAVRKIQNCFRQFSCRLHYADQMILINRSRMLNKISTAVVGRGRFYILKREALQDRAILCIQRSVRGWIARARMRKKRLFIRSIKNAVDAVQPTKLQPRSIDTLASYIEAYMSDTSIYLPIELMTLLRTILFMLNGSSPEVLDVIIAKKVHTENVFAENLSWMKALKVLRRKARLLRRMRALAERVQAPNAVCLKFDDACVKHLSEAMKTLNPRVFNALPLSIRGCVTLLFEFVVNIERVYRLQTLFPEYFVCSQPGWFKKLISLRSAHELNLIQYRVAASCSEILEKEKEDKIRSGVKFGHYANAFKSIAITLQSAEDTVKASGKKLMRFLLELDQSEKKRLYTLTELEKSRVLGFKIAKRELETYMRLPGTPDETIIANMTFDIDDRKIGLLDCRVRLAKCIRFIDQDKASRAFEDMLSFDEIFKMEAEISVIVSRLLVLKEALDEFLFLIGGVQFIDDLRGEERDKYYALKEEVMSCIHRRRLLVASVDRNIKTQFGIIKATKASERYEYFMAHQEWDVPEDIEIEAEKEENYICAARDLEKRSRQSLTPNKVIIEPRNDVSPVLVLIDGFVPRKTLQNIIKNLTALHFEHYYIKNEITEVYDLAQRSLSKGRNVVIIVNRGIHAMSRVYFNSSLFTLKHALSPSPRVCLVNGYDVFRCLDWISEVSTSMEVLSSTDIEGAYHCVLNKGRLKHLAEIFKLCAGNDDEANVFVKFVPMNFRGTLKLDTEEYLNLVRVYIRQVEEQGCDAAFSKFHDFATQQRFAFLLLAAGLGSVFALWKPGRIAEIWPGNDILLGAKSFISFCPTVEKVSDLLEKHSLIATSTMMHAFIMGSSSFIAVWDFIRNTYDFYRNPCIRIFYEYYHRAMEFLLVTSKAGGIPSNEASDAIDVSVSLDWNGDVLSDTSAKRVTGEILSAAMQHAVIFETKRNVSEYHSKPDIFDVTQCVTEMYQNKYDIKVYHQAQNVYASVNLSDIRDSPFMIFGHITQDEVFDSFQPNGVETFESRVPHFEFGVGQPAWFERMADWILLQCQAKNDSKTIADSCSLHIVRSRYMLHSMIGILNGYKCRIEVYEESYGNLVYLMYGLPCGMRILSFHKNDYKLMSDCGDPVEERAAFDSIDVHRAAVLLGDRIRVTPSANMYAFLQDLALFPGQRNLLEHKIFFNRGRGPGRKLGSKFIKFEMQEFLITLIELHNESDSYFLRILVYTQKTSRTIEYRLSPLERVLLFYGQSESLFDDIISRFNVVRVSKKEFDDERNGLIPLAEDICMKAQLKHESLYSHRAVDLKDDENALSGRLLKLYYIPERTYRLVSEILPTGEEVFNRISEEHGPELMTDREVRYALHFDRTGASRTIGNVKISVALILSREGFLFTIYDKYKRFMNYAFVPFSDIHKPLGLSLGSLLRTIDKIDDSDIVTELLDDILKSVRLTATPDLPNLSRFVLSSADRQEIINLSFVELSEAEHPVPAPSIHSQDPLGSAESAPISQEQPQLEQNIERPLSASSQASWPRLNATSTELSERTRLKLERYVESIGRKRNYHFVRYSSPVANLTNGSESDDVGEGASYTREYFDLDGLKAITDDSIKSPADNKILKRKSVLDRFQSKLDALNTSSAKMEKEKFDIKKILLQYPFVYQHVVVAETEDPSRICWRGKLYLKDVDSVDKVVLKRPMQRALKLTNWVHINNVKVMK